MSALNLSWSELEAALYPLLAILGLAVITLVTRSFFMLPERELPLPDRLAREAHDWTLTPKRSQANFAYYARRALANHPDALSA
mgnify:CR=1 FL=1